MTDEPAPQTLEGDVTQGKVGQFVSTFYTGPVGHQVKRNGALEVAYFGKPPRSTDGDRGAATLDGVAVKVISAADGRNEGFAVLICEPVT